MIRSKYQNNKCHFLRFFFFTWVAAFTWKAHLQAITMKKTKQPFATPSLKIVKHFYSPERNQFHLASGKKRRKKEYSEAQ